MGTDRQLYKMKMLVPVLMLTLLSLAASDPLSVSQNCQHTACNQNKVVASTIRVLVYMFLVVRTLLVCTFQVHISQVLTFRVLASLVCTFLECTFPVYTSLVHMFLECT